MPPKKINNNNRNIRDFFKPYTVPKSRIAINNDPEDGIVVVQPATQPGNSTVDPRQPASSDSTQSSKSLSRHPTSSPTNSPLKRAPRKTPPKRSNSSANDDLCHSSPSSATQLEISVVAIPSLPPQKRSPSSFMAPKPLASDTQPTRSFSSFSTISSVPQSSGGSRRMMRDGLQAVANSDSDSDSMEELADLDTFMPRKKMKMTPPPDKDATDAIQLSNNDNLKEKHGHFGKSSAHGNRTSRPPKPQLPKSPPRATYKFSLAKMAAESRKRQKADARIAEAEAAVEAAQRLRETEAASADSLAHLDAAKLTEMFDAEEDENQRTILALARTEALERRELFDYFKPQPRKAKDLPFPVHSLPKASWAERLDDMETREQACLSGFIADLASCNMLNKDVTTWFAQQLIHEPREELCEAYVEIIRAATEYEDQVDGKVLSTLQTFYWTTVTTGEIQAPSTANDIPMSSQLSAPLEDFIFCICGSDEDHGRIIACDGCDTWQHSTCYYPQYDEKKMPEDFEHQCVKCKPRAIDKAAAQRRRKRFKEESESSSDTSAQLPDRAPGLPFIARVLQCYAPLADIGRIGRAICDLALANNDDYVRTKVGWRQALAHAIEALCDSVQPEEVDGLYKYALMTLLTDDKLSLNMQARLVASLPATSAQTHVFRRRLALYLVTKSQKLRPLTSPEWVNIIIKRLKTAPEYAMGEKSDYDLILNLITVLDVAIDAGFSDFSFHNKASTQSVNTGPFGTTQPVMSVEEKAYNRNVDLLSGQIKEMAGRITGAGATHVKRVEAKSALERVCLRLEYGVRTKPKPRKGVFGELGNDMESRKSMQEFVRLRPKDETLVHSGGAGDAQPLKHSLELPERPSPMKKRASIVEVDATPKAASDADDSFHTALEEKDDVEEVPEEVLSDREMSDEEDPATQGADELAPGDKPDRATPRDPVPKSSWNFVASCVRF
ncbi:hypothetical protein Tdes44962_MAKER01843 [Teratosphaeria destructans]|uniref:PHD-type domain-containing protein n=1 Tax=Teratosphaeria destructans TaxID=418781 RepID=A0A9W7SWX4_9PEZI|nr:hypothetical protein Tdes44962_MAKER01843 [Teratosphaeria destructans]